jgi:hypothetical protein
VATGEYHACGGAGGAEFGNAVSSSDGGSDCGYFRIRRGTNELGIEADIVAGMVAPASGGSTCTEACGSSISYNYYPNAVDGKVGVAMLVQRGARIWHSLISEDLQACSRVMEANDNPERLTFPLHLCSVPIHRHTSRLECTWHLESVVGLHDGYRPDYIR